MDGASIAAVLALGAEAGQFGTVFIDCTESSADDAHRKALHSPAAFATELTSVISGRPTRCLANSFTGLIRAELAGLTPPDYPITYAAGKALIDFLAATAGHNPGDGTAGDIQSRP